MVSYFISRYIAFILITGDSSGNRVGTNHSDANMHNLFRPHTPRSQTPNLDALSQLLQQTTPPSSMDSTVGGGIGGSSSVGTIGSNIGAIGSMSNMTSLSNMMTNSSKYFLIVWIEEFICENIFFSFRIWPAIEHV